MRAFLLALPVALMGTAALAEMTIAYPREACATIKGTDFSAPGGDSSLYLFEMLCEDAQGRHTVFMTNWRSGSSMLGFARGGIPDAITLVADDVTGLVRR